MASECTPTPTETEFTTITTFSLATSTVLSTAVQEPVVTTITSQICLDVLTLLDGVCVTKTTTTEIKTIPGATITNTLSTTLTIPVITTSATETLFSKCPSTTTSPPVTPPPPTSTSTSTPPPTTTTTPVDNRTNHTTSTILPVTNGTNPDQQHFTTLSTTFISTPPPTTFTTRISTTLDDGNVIGTDMTVTSTPDPFVVVSVTAVPTIQSYDDSNGSGPSKPQVGVILGSVLGGVFGMLLFCGLFWLFRKHMRRNPWEDKLNDKRMYPDDFSTDERPRRDLRASTLTPDEHVLYGYSDRPKPVHTPSRERQPYQYGIVGHVVPTLADDRSSSHHTTPMPSPGAHSGYPVSPGLSPAFGSGPEFGVVNPGHTRTLTPVHIGTPPPRHSPAPSTASDQPLIPRLSSPPLLAQASMSSQATSAYSRSTAVSLTGPPVTNALPMPIVREEPRRRSTSLSLSPSTGTPSSSFVRSGPLTLANWNPNTDGLLIDMESDSFTSSLSTSPPKVPEGDARSVTSTVTGGTATPRS